MPQTQPSYVTKYVVEDNVISCNEKLAIPCTVKKVATYSKSILMLTTDGKVFALGTNECSQLGIPYSEQTLHEPTLVPIENVTDITLKHERSLFLCEDNSLYGSGENTKFALGLNEEQIYMLIKVPSENYQSEKILFITTAYSFSIIVTDNHNLFVFGNNWLIPSTRIPAPSTLYPIPHVTKNGNVVALGSGTFHVGILNSAGEVFLGGDSDSGKLGYNGDQYFGLAKLETNYIFSTMYLENDYTALGTESGLIKLYGVMSLEDAEPKSVKPELQFPSVKDISGQDDNLFVCTEDNRVFRYNNTEETVQVVDVSVDHRYQLITGFTCNALYLCSGVRQDGIARSFPLLLKTIYRTELHDLVVS